MIKNSFIRGEFKINLKKCKSCIDTSDYRFNYLVKKFTKENLNIDVSDFYDLESFEEKFDFDMNDIFENFSADKGNIGGYVGFTQTDPRTFEEKEESIYLLKIDSMLDKRIEIGDNGVAWILIKKSDLINKDFSKGQFDWDCY